MKPSLSPKLVKRSLASHSWVGLLVGALMYLVCLSGTLAVFYQEFERWEQPRIEEYVDHDPARIEQAVHRAQARMTRDTEHLFVGLPTTGMPRASVSSDHGGWFVNPDGSLGAAINHEWTHLLVHLHLFLHLPQSFGMIVVSALGAMLCALILSGFLAHPRLFRDAFTLRLRGSRHLEQADIHNRLSVWGAPFHLMIAITGAYFGLAVLLSYAIASIHYDGDTDAVIAAVFGADPQLHQAVNQPLAVDQPLAVGKALREIRGIAPEAEPFYVTVEDVGTPEQFMIVGARHPGRLIYAEQYRFDAAGNYLDKVGFSDGDAGRQAIYSVYRLHFGHFGGFAVKVVYGILGLALTVVAVTGINIWFARRRTRDYLNNLWTGFVWGTPAALALTAVTQILLGLPSTALFWLALVAAMAWAQWNDDDARNRRHLQLAGGALLSVLVAGHALHFGGDAFSPAALGVNTALLATALALVYLATRRRPGTATARSTPEAATRATTGGRGLSRQKSQASRAEGQLHRTGKRETRKHTP